MPERLENMGDTNIFSSETTKNGGIKLKNEAQNRTKSLDNVPSILDKILSSPTSRHITCTSGPNSR